MTPIHLSFNLDVGGHGCDLIIRSFEKQLTLPHYLELIETWLNVQKVENAQAIQDFDELKKSGKIVDIGKWKYERRK